MPVARRARRGCRAGTDLPRPLLTHAQFVTLLRRRRILSDRMSPAPVNRPGKLHELGPSEPTDRRGGVEADGLERAGFCEVTKSDAGPRRAERGPDALVGSDVLLLRQ